MAYVNGTTHYNLPQTVGTDKRDWADTNQAFSDIDAALYGAVDDVAQAQTEIDALTGRMNTAEENISDNTADIADLDTRLTTAEGAITSQQSQITDLRQDTEDMICAYNEASATSTHAYEIGEYFIYNDVLYKATQAIAIDDTIVPDTNCATTNVTTELLATEDLSGDVEQLQTDVAALQPKVAKTVNSTEIINTVLPNTTFNAAFTTVATTINSNRDYEEYVVIIGNSIFRMSEKTASEIRLSCPFMASNGDMIFRNISFNTSNVGIFSQFSWAVNGTLTHADLLADTSLADRAVIVRGVNNSNT